MNVTTAARRLFLGALSPIGLLAAPFDGWAEEPPSAAAPPSAANASATLEEISPEEPLADAFSLSAAARYLDAAAVSWQETHACTACHTMFPYMMARPALASVLAPPPTVRRFFEEVAAGERNPMPDYHCGDVDAAVAIGVAASLAINDRLAAGTLHPLTRRALDCMWTLQRPDGGWQWPFRDTPPLKVREHYAATLAAVAAGMAPDDYARSDQARLGLEGIRRFLAEHPAETLHEEAMLLWASSHVPALATEVQRGATLEKVLAAQRPDGGWSLGSLVENPLSTNPLVAEAAALFRGEPGFGIEFAIYSGREAAYKSSLASDGYATGFAIYVCRQAGMPTADERLQRGIAWLKTHQRASGRWFTPSQSWHSQNKISNAGTGYAVLSLFACGEVPGPEAAPPSDE